MNARLAQHPARTFAGVLALGAWGAQKKKEERAASPPQYSSPFLMCMTEVGYRDQTDCLKRNGLQDMTGDDQRTEPRRK